jgi:O-antigen ligase
MNANRSATLALTAPAGRGDTPFASRAQGVAQMSGAIPQLSWNVASWALILTLAWAQFPLGSNRPWSWSLLVLLVSLVWLVWLPSALSNRRELALMTRRLLVPGLLLAIPLIWAALQCVSWTPPAWHNGIWNIAPDGGARTGAVSMNPFATATELMKLVSYVAAGFVAMMLARRHTLADRTLGSIVVIGVGYALYGMVLSMIGSSQATIFEHVAPPYGIDVTGGFVSKNSFSSFDGIVLIVCTLLIVERAQGTIVTSRGWRPLVVSALQFGTGRGVLRILAWIVLFLALLLSDSRAGLLATLGALAILLVFGMIFAARGGATLWALGAGTATLITMSTLFMFNGSALQDRFDQLIETRGAGELRPVLWSAAERAILDHPMLGNGLGAFKESYYLYADRFEPFVVDRVHNDYLELALGLGIPMAASFILGIAALVVLCVAGVARRKRRRIFALAAVGAGVLVGLHSAVDFSLQMPAASLLFATVVGVGLGQSWPEAHEFGPFGLKEAVS